MPETVKIPGIKKPLNKNVVYIGGAAAAGFVGYAWFTANRAPAGSETIPEEELPEPVPEPTDTPGFDVSGGGPPPATNADWWDRVMDKLVPQGYDGNILSAAIGKFLDHKRLTAAEVVLIQAAIGAAGPPPQFGPWEILQEDSGQITPGLLAPANFQATGGPNTVNLSWSPVSGAVGYETKLVGLPYKSVGSTQTETVPMPVHTAPKSHQFAVRAVGPTGGKGPEAFSTATVLPAGGGGGGGGGGGSTQLKFRSGRRTRTSITWAWNAVPGAAYYVVWPEIGGAGDPPKRRVRGTSWTWSRLKPGHQYGLTVVALNSSGKEISNRIRSVHSTMR